MAYAPIDEHFDEHPKFEPLELEHYGLMACAIVYCNRNLTDGKVSFKAVRAFGKSGKGPRLAKRLTELGIWRDIETGWEIVGFLDHNPCREEVLAKREAARLRKETWRKGAGGDPKALRVPSSVPTGQNAGQISGRDGGQTVGRDAGQNRLSLARARAPAGGIRSTALHSDPIQRSEIPEEVGDQDEHQRPRLTRFEEPFWRASYSEVVQSALGGGWGFPDKQLSGIRKAIEAHCKHLADIDGWLRAAVAAFVDACRDRPGFYAHLGPDGLLKWLNERSALRDPFVWPRTVAVESTSPDADEQADYAPPSPEEAAELREALNDLLAPKPAASGPRRVGEDLSAPAVAELEAKRKAVVESLRAEAKGER